MAEIRAEPGILFSFELAFATSLQTVPRRAEAGGLSHG